MTAVSSPALSCLWMVDLPRCETVLEFCKNKDRASSMKNFIEPALVSYLPRKSTPRVLILDQDQITLPGVQGHQPKLSGVLHPPGLSLILHLLLIPAPCPSTSLLHPCSCAKSQRCESPFAGPRPCPPTTPANVPADRGTPWLRLSSKAIQS